MTLETAKRIVEEQRDRSNAEALAVIRGGMVHCERTKDGRHVGPWIEVLPTATDEESSIEKAIKRHRVIPKYNPFMVQAKKEPAVVKLETSLAEPDLQPPNTAIVFITSSIRQYLVRIEKKILELWKEFDECVQE